MDGPRPDRRPRLDVEAAAQILRREFGLRGSLRPLPGERDQNFLVVSPDGSRVLKLANRDDERTVLEMQDALLRRLDDGLPDFETPTPVETPGGRTIVELEGPDGYPLLARVLTWVPGTPLADAHPHPPELLGEVGRLLGRTAGALRGFEHPAARRRLPWDLTRAEETIRGRMEAIEDPDRRGLLEGVLDRWQGDCAGRADELRRSVIHNDGNDHNVICGPLEEHPAGWRRAVRGLVDVGDALESWTAAEAAVGAAYALLGRPAPLDAACALVEGFHSELPFEEAEVDLLFELIRLRLCLSVVNSAVQRAQDPGNEYLSISEDAAWNALGSLGGIHPRLATYRLRAACGMEPCPAGRRLRGWIEQRAGTFHPVVEPALADHSVHAFDLTMGSTEMGGGAPGDFDTGAATERLFGLMERAGAAIGLGRYDEIRCWYGGSLFATPGNDGPRRRTLHIGVDVFLEPGAPLAAPLEGIVAAAADNAGRLDYGPTIVLEHEPDDGPRFWTLWGHLDPACLQELEPGERVEAGRPFAAVGDAPDNGDWPPHLHLQVIADRLDHEGDFPGVADPAQRDVWTGICPDPLPLLGIDLDPPQPSRRVDAQTILETRQRHLGRSLSLSYRRPLHLVRGWMQHLYDADGQPYLDAVNNVPHVGHCHPRVVTAANLQNEVLATNTRYLHDALARYVERLAASLPEPLTVCTLVSSGSEANELALRMARAHTGARDVVVLDGAYHGNTGALVDMSPYKHAGPGGSGPPEWVHVAAMPDPYRGVHRGISPEVATAYAEDVARRCREAAAGGGLAAFFAEPLLGCGGQIVPPPGYLAAAFERVRDAGGVCVADEVQIGLGRVGSHLWAFESQGAVPDIVTLGKPLGNGYPLAAVVTTPEIADSFAGGMEYFATFGGNPVACAAGLAVLDVLADEGLQENARLVGGGLLASLGGLQRRHELIGDVRGRGLYLGVQLVRDRESRDPAPRVADQVVNRLRERAILVSTDGPFHDVIKIKPPMCFSEADADRLAAALDEVLAEDLPREEDGG